MGAENEQLEEGKEPASFMEEEPADADNDGKLSFEEVVRHAKQSNAEWGEESEVEMKGFFQEGDADKDGFLSQDEFAALAEKGAVEDEEPEEGKAPASFMEEEAEDAEPGLA